MSLDQERSTEPLSPSGSEGKNETPMNSGIFRDERETESLAGQEVIEVAETDIETDQLPSSVEHESKGPSKKNKLIAALTGVAVMATGAVASAVLYFNRPAQGAPEATPQSPETSAPVTPGPNTASPSLTPETTTSAEPSSSASPSPEVTNSSSTEPTPETSTKPISTEEDPIYKDVFELPTIAEFSKMSSEERLEAIRLPESLLTLENSQALFAAYFDTEAFIYNFYGSDEEYHAYKATGGLDYVTHVVEGVTPLMERLDGGTLHETYLEGIDGMAHRIAIIHYYRNVAGFTDLFVPFHFKYDIYAAERVTASIIEGTFSHSSSLDETQSQYLNDLDPTTIIPPLDESPQKVRLTNIHFNKELGTIQAKAITSP